MDEVLEEQILQESYICRDETYAILGACFEVSNEKGCGFLEPVYQECLEIEMGLRDIPFESQARIPLFYKGRKLAKFYEPDFLCFSHVVVEIKAVSNLSSEHEAQLINYLNATEYPVGLLVNLGHYPRLEYKRFANSLGAASVSEDPRT